MKTRNTSNPSGRRGRLPAIRAVGAATGIVAAAAVWAAVLAMGWGCGPVSTDVSPPSPDLSEVPEVIDIDGHEYSLETYLWRDFQPISPPDGQPLVALVRVRRVDGRDFPPGIDATTLWVLKGSEVWESGFDAAGPPRTGGDASTIERTARGGPKWGPGIHVDVVVKLEDTKGREWLLRAADQLIERTD